MVKKPNIDSETVKVCSQIPMKLVIKFALLLSVYPSILTNLYFQLQVPIYFSHEADVHMCCLKLFFIKEAINKCYLWL